MAVYTDVSKAELEGFLADFDLDAALAFKGVAEGVENSNFMLETQGGCFILTLYEKRTRAADLPFFLGLMGHLAARGYPCPTPIADRAGVFLKSLRGKPAALTTFLPGRPAAAPTIAHCLAAGEGLAWLHLAAQDFAERRANDLGHAAWAAMFAPLSQAAEALEPGLARSIEADVALLADAWPADLPRGIVHADYFPDNVFFEGGRFVGAIDFYFAAYDALAYDIGVALNAWCFEPDGAFDAIKARALVDGYQRRRTLTKKEKAALPLMARGGAMRFFLTRLADWGATPAGALVAPKNPLEYARRLAAHRAGIDILGGVA
ncbi:MAG: homoserine kinase [Pseudomonadota bacterium]|nr:homoserine kinase [Pseudomonadota bacterium]